ncbi:related to glyoxal oxidase precursor [Phialocephala subalpina]|uniref:Related to glyoxal oxidase n=1 Tax=Phialocephala subalpina TaxID=576137 RepID=A0A1L7WLT3_9HELO|nr:related to glyoxal oxidase precursor [Phialocephala subalpina]
MVPTLVQSVWALALYSLLPQAEAGKARDVRAVVQPRATGWAYVGCYVDQVGARTLTVNPGTTGGTAALTVELCTSTCQGLGYVFAGMEYAGECYCGNSFANGGGPASDGEVGCNMACNGNATEICGGSYRLSVWDYNDAIATVSSSATTASSTASSTSSSASATSTLGGWTSLGCYNDTVGVRTLSTEIYSIPGASMTVELCLAACAAASFTYAGLEYAGECYCDTKIENYGAPASDGCDMACNGNAAETCGGANRLNMYLLAGSGTGTTTSSTSGTGSVTSTSSTSTTSAPVITSLPTGWTYKGCWIDQAYGRILSTQSPDSATLTVESCVAACVALGYSIAGMEYYTQCYCGNSMINQAALATADTDCNTACGGNSAEMCGGGDRMSIYSNETTLDITPVPQTQLTGLPGSWNYSGCLLDNAVTRTFPYQLEFLNNNTATNCLSQCQLFGYGAGGMEYGEQCFCGDVQNVIDSGATLQAEGDCNMVCSGNDSYICGGPSRISYYTWTGAPLASWDFRTGISAGEYQFLIGGPIIPLIAQPGVNGKITFLEKFGTEPANNSTGAYELDLKLLNNYTAAWRPMHVKSDVFCAASLTLPDKAGRMLDIGGWANDATYGVRLYWPDGTPGTWGVNDWEENVLEVHLQAGRWYPSAMIMANGSILVMGGEEGSNGAPIPSLEVLPLPPGSGTLYCDYLDRTDPYNLYPYLAVLPTGGIFVAYYNEARILDEVSLQTQKVLPNIPGAVNDFLGGRTYPFEGTAVLLPQYAPYTEALTIMICGGSIPGPEIALDNCVSLQPEVSGANWTIERMPSKRVISSICALPDGTYMIMNGGQQGRAGFGLATQPNYNAVLYDPSKPLNSRMSVMANTTIMRLYHSEAVLLQDGRILVSGSDPEDVRFPQEYRVEVFLPPYLLSGATPPSYNITSKDIAYGGTTTLTITLPTGNFANMKISLMASVASTHGNSMGQRTIFPAFSCSGNVCTVTAPPNAHVCPPGWHMLFVLDDGVPSYAEWVRIGGDPAGLGNWPDYPDFTLPGV